MFAAVCGERTRNIVPPFVRIRDCHVVAEDRGARLISVLIALRTHARDW